MPIKKPMLKIRRHSENKGTIMNKFFLTVLFILTIIGGRIDEAFAGFDAINNALMTSNSFLKQGALVQEQYSTIARNIVSAKVSVDVGIDMDKPQKMMEKAESVKEEAEKLQDRIETAKENVEEMKAKYDNLKAQVLEYKAKADKALAQVQEIRDQYNTYKAQVLDGINTVKDGINSAKEAASSIKDLAESKVDGLKEKAGIKDEAASDAEDADADNIPSEGEADATAEEEIVKDEEEYIEEDEEAEDDVAPAPQPIMLPNKADAIRSAGEWADMNTVAVPVVAIPADGSEFMQLPQTEVMVDDVVAAAATAAAAATEEENGNTAVTEEQHSELNLEEQLQLSSNRPQMIKKASPAEKAAELADLVKAAPKDIKAAQRAKFATAEAKEAVAAKVKATAEALKKPMKTKAVNKVKNIDNNQPQAPLSHARKAFTSFTETKEKTDAE